MLMQVHVLCCLQERVHHCAPERLSPGHGRPAAARALRAPAAPMP